MPIKTDNQIRLSSNYTVGYAEYGDPLGQPVLYFHGCPSSRFEVSNPDITGVPEQLHVRLIVPDRPGVGLSDFKPYTLPSYADLVAELANKLGLDRFAVVGTSSGGKFVAACAWKMPQRLTAAIIVSGSAPFDMPGARATLSQQDRLMYDLAEKAPWLFRLMLWKLARDTRKNPAALLALFSEMSAPDKAVMARPNVTRVLGQMVVEAFRQGTRGAALDWKLEARPWGFALSEIKMPVAIWHGEVDTLAPIEQARIQAKAIPNAQLKTFPDDGHTLFFNRFEDLLTAAIG